MPLKDRLLRFGSNLTRTVAGFLDQDIADRRNTEIFIQAALGSKGELSELNNPVAYIEFLRRSFEPQSLAIRRVKSSSKSDVPGLVRFNALLERLGSGVLPVPYATAIKIAREADTYRGLSSTSQFHPNWSADTALHFEVSSSFGRKGRLIYNIVRFCRPQHCLELGTAYGMSAMFILEAQIALRTAAQLVTVEQSKETYSLSAPRLLQLYPNLIECLLGTTADQLPRVVQARKQFEFMFHDAGHSYKDYVDDFAAIEPLLVPGAMVAIDDIQWDDSRFTRERSRCYEGWRAIVESPRVLSAAEVAGIGLVLIG